MRICVLEELFSDETVTVVLGAFTSPGVCVEWFCKKNLLDDDIKKDILKQISSQVLRHSYCDKMYFHWDNCSYMICDCRVIQ